MTRNPPEDGSNNPSLVRAMYNAIEHGVSPTVAAEERQAEYGKRWILSYRRTITSTENALYVYVDNPDGNSLAVEGVTAYTDGTLLVDVYDEPTLDESTFTSEEFRNTRSSVTKDPPWNAYSQTENNATVSDEGRPFSHELLESGNKSSVGERARAPGYIVDKNSSALIKFTNDNGNDVRMTATIYFHEQVDSPDLTQLDGTN